MTGKNYDYYFRLMLFRCLYRVFPVKLQVGPHGVLAAPVLSRPFLLVRLSQSLAVNLLQLDLSDVFLFCFL